MSGPGVHGCGLLPLVTEFEIEAFQGCRIGWHCEVVFGEKTLNGFHVTG
jgi:hypothetical protein